MIHFHDKRLWPLCDYSDEEHEEVRFPEQKATAEEQGMDAVRKDMETDTLQTWNDKEHGIA